MKRTEVIGRIVQALKPRTYLEIGVWNGKVFLGIEVAEKHAVDPKFCISLTDKLLGSIKNPTNLGNHYHEVTSDEFFRSLDTQKSPLVFDLVFVDGLHTHAQAFKDVENSLQRLSPNGIIIVHDCNPPHKAVGYPAESFEAAMAANPEGWDGNWTGDVWKAIMQLRKRSDLEVFVLDCDYGVALVRKAPAISKLPAGCPEPAAAEYEYFAAHRQQILDLRPTGYLEEFVKTVKPITG